MKITAPVTVELLDAAPVGSRIIFDWEEGSSSKAIYRKVEGGWSLTNLNGRHEHFLPATAEILVNSWAGHTGMARGRTRILPPRQPAPIRIWSWTATLGRSFYSWRCNTCGDFDVCFLNSQAAHTAGRAHAKGHVEVES